MRTVFDDSGIQRLKWGVIWGTISLVAGGCVIQESTGPSPDPQYAQPAPPPDPPPASDMPGEAPPPVPETPAPGPDAAFTVSLQRTPCFGRCPIYVVTVDSRGTITFDGERFVAQTGRHEATMDPSTMSALRQAIVDSDFFSLNDCYCERRVTDMPSVIVTVDWNGQKKTVNHYTGDRSAPKRLLTLQEKIDDLSGSKRWIDGAAVQ